jgi:hypothetical protein
MMWLRAIVQWLKAWLTFPQRLAKIEINQSNASHLMHNDYMSMSETIERLSTRIDRFIARPIAVTIYFINYEAKFFDSVVLYGMEGERKVWRMTIQSRIPTNTMVVIAGGELEQLMVGNLLMTCHFGMFRSRLCLMNAGLQVGNQITAEILFGIPRNDRDVQTAGY